MRRRELFRLLAAGAVLPALSPDVLAMFQAAQPAIGYALRTLNAHQNSAITTMIDMILPETDTPGAKAARVNEFIDLILTEWATDGERQNFLKGLADVDRQCIALYGKDFVDCVPAQQEEMLRALDEHAAVERVELEKTPARRQARRDDQLNGNFFGVLKRMTVYGYYTSEIGFQQELKLEIIPGSYHGCTPLPENKA